MSTITPINVGTLANDGTGDPLQVAFRKINDNFTHLGNLVPNGPTGSLQYIDANGYFAGTANAVYDSTHNQLDLGATVVPLSDAGIDLGTAENRIGNLHLANTFALGNISISETGNTISFPVTVLTSKLADLHFNNANLDGNLTVSGSVTFEAINIGKFSVTTPDNTTNQVIFQMPASQFNAGVFQITSRDGSTSSQTVTLSVMTKNDGSSVHYSAYGTVFIGYALTRYNVDIGYGNVRIMVNPILNTSITHVGTYEITRA